ncbi:hypothetical protein Mgra_00001518 [Meloidogyne graminicola]|uniref:Uncharacterized protein n=1 Tax=Meloidogyne graminicola TaxID=189291 RepID=A0A8T0A0C7_9BILA|nr:hypothetical protein Mgra_00001518 [Meloidogyne graminicola]
MKKLSDEVTQHKKNSGKVKNTIGNRWEIWAINKKELICWLYFSYSLLDFFNKLVETVVHRHLFLIKGHLGADKDKRIIGHSQAFKIYLLILITLPYYPLTAHERKQFYENINKNLNKKILNPKANPYIPLLPHQREYLFNYILHKQQQTKQFPNKIQLMKTNYFG